MPLAADDTVVVEVWDVVDQARPKSPPAAEKNASAAPRAQQFYEEEEDDHEEQRRQDPAELLSRKVSGIAQQQGVRDGSHTVNMLDAGLIDVYKGAHAAIFIFDITKKWTFEYVKSEIRKVPSDVDVVLLANYFDMASKRVIMQPEIEQLVKNLGRETRCIETSMKNCYGLRTLYTYFDLPYLKMKVCCGWRRLCVCVLGWRRVCLCVVDGLCVCLCVVDVVDGGGCVCVLWMMFVLWNLVVVVVIILGGTCVGSGCCGREEGERFGLVLM